jgi:hypothetical protein
MPGVNVTSTTRTGPVAQNTAPSGQLFVAGQAYRGSTTKPTLVQGLADFEDKFGTRQSYSHLHDNMRVFFEEGGSQAYVVRVVGPSATTGTVTLVDRAGSPLSTLKFDAASQGAWSDDLQVVVADGSVASTVTVSVLMNSTVVEIYRNLTDPAAVALAFEGSPYVLVTNMGSATVAPNNNPATGTFNVSAGSDDRANILASHYTAALALFLASYGDGAVAIPGIGATVHAGLISHANTHNRIALLSEAEGASIATLKSTAAGLNSEYAGLFSPWVKISTDTGVRYTSPEGYIAGVRNRAHMEAGPWRAPAGQIAVARSLVGLKADYTRAEGDDLDANKVNAIRNINNSVRNYGWRSLSNDVDNYSLIVGRDVLNRVVVASERELEQFVFQTIDGKNQLLSAINGALVGVVEPMARAGGLFARYDADGNLLDPGFGVDTGPSVNSPANLAANEVKARVSVRVAPSAATISVTIVKVGLLSGL